MDMITIRPQQKRAHLSVRPCLLIFVSIPRQSGQLIPVLPNTVDQLESLQRGFGFMQQNHRSRMQMGQNMFDNVIRRRPFF